MIVVAIAAALASAACGSGSGGSTGTEPTATGSGGITATFSGGITGVAPLTGGGPGHMCGPQTGKYSAILHAPVGSGGINLRIELRGYIGGGTYDLTPPDSYAQVVPADANPMIQENWTSTAGTVVVDSTGYGGSIDATLSPQGQTPSRENVTVRGSWTCSRPNPTGS